MAMTLYPFFQIIKRFSHRFWVTSPFAKEYYLKIDSYYYCQRQEKLFVMIRVRNKRMIDKIAIADAVNNKDYLQALHPADACIIGILASYERNCLATDYRTINRLKDYSCFIKSQPLLYIAKKYNNSAGDEMVVLRSKCLDKEIEISAMELCNNQALLYALDAFQAISIGYGANESWIKQTQTL